MAEWKKCRKLPITVEFREPIPNEEVYIWQADKNRCQERIQTLEGQEIAIPGIDYVIKGVNGELYPIKKEIFAKTYEVIK